jgi:hypothetical protein
MIEDLAELNEALKDGSLNVHVVECGVLDESGCHELIDFHRGKEVLHVIE